jgi:AcrR family transcriptional regulator
MAAEASGLPDAGGARPRRARGRPRDGRVDEAVLSATLELLGEVGYARLTVDRVAARAGVSKPSLYLRWPGKVSLVAEALQHWAGALPEEPDTGSLRQDMAVHLREVARSHRAAERALAAVSSEIATNPELRHAFRRGVAGRLLSAVRVIVTRAVERGELPADTDVQLLSILPQALLHYLLQVDDRRPEGIEERIAERIARQFFTPAARPDHRPPAARPESSDDRDSQGG